MFTCDLCTKLCKSQSGLTRHRGSGVCIENQVRNARGVGTLHSSASFAPEESLVTRLIAARKERPILPHIPAAAREACAEELIRLFDFCCTKNDEAAWTDLFLFASKNLHAPPSKAGKGPSLATSVKANIRGQLVSQAPRRKPKKENHNNQDAIRRLVNKKLQDGDISGAVRILSSEDSVAEINDDVLRVLKEKHPDPPADLDGTVRLVDPHVVAADVSCEEVVAAVNSFPRGSGAGPDGLRPAHLKDLASMQGEGGRKWMEALVGLVNHVIKNPIPSEARKILFGANLTPLKKKCGGIRPIASGCTLRRLVAKIISRRVQERFGELFRPVQLGYGTKGGAETAIHSARAFLQADRDDVASTPKLLMKVDFKNAFNTVRRDVMLKKVAEAAPEYYHFISAAYEEPSILFCGQETLASAHGIQQGDPLGPWLFCLVTDELSKSLESELNLWFLDDATVGGTVKDVLDDFRTITEGAARLGLEVNFKKCELFVSETTPEGDTDTKKECQIRAPGVQFLPACEMELLGAPLFENGIKAVLSKKIGQASVLTGRLGMLSSHQAFFLLRNCLSLPKLLYVLRCAPCWKAKESLAEYDELIRNKVEELTNVKMKATVRNDENIYFLHMGANVQNLNNLDPITSAWDQASLPVRYGGLGIQKASDLAFPAYISSLAASSDLMAKILGRQEDLHTSGALVEDWIIEHGISAPAQANWKYQRLWTEALFVRKLESMMQRSDAITSCRLLAAASKESGAWLTALPVAAFGNHLDDSTFRISVALRLGVPVCAKSTCVCGAVADELGHHGLSCKKSKGRYARHAALNETIHRALTTAKIASELEPTGMDREDGKRPDGATYFPWRNGKIMVWDVTVVDIFAISYVAQTSKAKGAAADSAEARKVEKYASFLDRYIFQPIGFETTGTWGSSATSFMKELGKRIREHNGNPRTMEFLRQRISIDIQRGNARCVLGTVDAVKDRDELFFVFAV